MPLRFPLLLAVLGALAACKPNTPPPVTDPPPSPPPVATPADPLPAPPDRADADVDGDGFAWPASVGAFGGGYPMDRDPCRKLGETPVTGDYLDHTRDLVGCPGGPDSAVARALVAGGGRVVGQHDGVTMISIPGAEGP